MASPRSLRIVFLGTPGFAAVCLERLLETRHEVVGVAQHLTVPRDVDAR